MEYLIGAGLAVMVCMLALLLGLDRDRAFYPTMLMVVATYYILFAAMASSGRAIVTESVVAALFLVVAAAGFKGSPWLIVVGLAGHGFLDFFHGRFIEDPGVPNWWPGFCMAFDVIAAVFLAVRVSRSGSGLARCL
jgi:hypothetical protein